MNRKVCIKKAGDNIFQVTGNTIGCRNTLKACNGKFDAGQKCWVFNQQDIDSLLGVLSEGNISYELIQDNECERDCEEFQDAQDKLSNKYTFELKQTDSKKGFWVFGDTKDNKEILKSLGGSWNFSKKGWVFSMKRLEPVCNELGLPSSALQSS